MSDDLNLNSINFQTSLRDKPVRENFDDIQNNFNSLRTEFAAAVASTASEVTNARDYHTSLQNRIHSGGKAFGSSLVSGGVISAQGTPDMTVGISAGEAIVNGTGCKWSAQNSGVVTAPASNTRLDYIIVNSDNSISIVVGTPGVTPLFPTTSTTQLIIGVLVIKSTTTYLQDGINIFHFKDPHNDYFPNIYINVAYTATDKLHNNVIIDIEDAIITGTLECQGNCLIANYDNSTIALTNSTDMTLNGSYLDTTRYLIPNYHIGGDELIGTGGDPGSPNLAVFTGQSSAASVQTTSSSLSIKAFNIYVEGIDLSTGDGFFINNEIDAGSNYQGLNTIPVGYFGVGYAGGSTGDTGSITLEAVNEIIIQDINLSTGDGGNGAPASGGTIGNIGGKGGPAGDSGDLTCKCKTYTNNGTISLAAGIGGTGATGSGGSNNNKDGTDGADGTAGSNTLTLYDFTTGLDSDYANWVHSLYNVN